ncbi:MAG TPA: hypothetical protein VGE52_12555, partial [Pirellulales bacterium]
MEIVAYLFRWAHVLSAVLLVGGAFFMRFVLIPAGETLPDETHQTFRGEIRKRWAPWVHGAVGVLLIAGLVNFYLKIVGYQLRGTNYHMLMGIKILLGLFVMTVASMLVGRSSLGQRLQKNAKFWLNLNIALAV